jgi:hypothetical protein
MLLNLMVKCEICKNTIEMTFLKKPIGTIVKDAKGKKHYICSQCQTTLGNDKEEILAKMK